MNVPYCPNVYVIEKPQSMRYFNPALPTINTQTVSQ